MPTLNTPTRRRVAKARDRANQRLTDKGWKHDGLWWISPHTKLRYAKREALSVEEIRQWGESESAFLKDKDHSMWVKKELEDNKLITLDQLSKISERNALIKRLAIEGCYGKHE